MESWPLGRPPSSDDAAAGGSALGAGATRVDAAFAAQPRARFLPASARRDAGVNAPLAIGHAQTNSQPSTVRDMLVLLDVRPGMRVLDLGAGSGWTTALLGELVGQGGTVVGVERVPELVEFGRGNLADARVPWARIETAADDALGAPGSAPFDRILVSAMARRLPDELIAQLTPGGVMVIPVDGTMLRVVRVPTAPGEPVRAEVSEHGGYAFVPLIDPL